MKVLNYTGLQNLWTNIRNYITAHTPTKTSDLTNDSNFVDTSNSAVASGITSVKVTDYDTHIADTDIHVTTADKSKWNNGVSQSYVFRYSSTALVASSTNSNSLLDNTDNLKVGDKVIDSDGVLFSITAIDSVNSTFTIGSALVDLALDANVVHTSGSESISGYKTFSYNMTLYNSRTDVNSVALFLKNKKVVIGSTTDIGSQNIAFRDSADTNLSILKTSCESVGNTSFEISVYNKDSNNQIVSGGMLISQTPANTYITPISDNAVLFGSSNRRWSKVYATNYYYGANNVEFSTKFVTTDTAQTISGDKSFSSDLRIANTDTTSNTPNLNLRNYKADRGTTDTAVQTIGFLDKNAKALTSIESRRVSNGNTATNILCYNTDDSNNTVSGGIAIIKGKTDTAFAPTTDNAVTCGRTLAKWSNVQTYKVNGLTPSSLSLPTDNIANIIDISGYLTVLDGSQANTYQAPDNGYIGITMSNCTGIQAYITGFWGNQIVRSTAGAIIFFMPICKNMTANILVFGGTVDNARFFPCQGNV